MHTSDYKLMSNDDTLKTRRALNEMAQFAGFNHATKEVRNFSRYNRDAYSIFHITCIKSNKHPGACKMCQLKCGVDQQRESS